MDKRDWADRFTQEVDSLLREVDRTDSEPRPAEYQQALELARRLIEIDFSDESKVRHSLKRHLLSRIEKHGAPQPKARIWFNRSFSQRMVRPLAFMGATILLLLVAMVVFFPGTVGAAAQQAYTALQVIVLGDDLMVEQFDALDKPPSPPTADFYGWSLDTDIGGFAGNLQVGEDTAMRVYDGFAEAQKLVDFPIQTPTELPAGYTLREIKLTPSSAPVSVFIFYRGPGHDIILSQHPVGKQSEEESDQPVTIEDESVTVTKTISRESIVILTDNTVKQVQVDGRLAVWIGVQRLDWEDDNIVYSVGGLDLTLEEAIAIAESLQ